MATQTIRIPRRWATTPVSHTNGRHLQVSVTGRPVDSRRGILRTQPAKWIQWWNRQLHTLNIGPGRSDAIVEPELCTYFPFEALKHGIGDDVSVRYLPLLSHAPSVGHLPSVNPELSLLFAA